MFQCQSVSCAQRLIAKSSKPRRAYASARGKPIVSVAASEEKHAVGTEPVSASAKARLRFKILNSISACVEVNTLVLNFETFAGRAAMVGFLVAVVSEGLTEQGVFQSVGEQQATSIIASALFCVVAAAVLASTSKRKFGLPLREAVISSLTAVQRSSASVSQRQVDSAVDYVFDDAFDLKTVHGLMEEDFI